MYSINKLNTIAVIILALSQIVPIASQPGFNSYVCQDTFGNYTRNSIFKKNLDNLISTITSDTKIDYGFYNLSFGKNLDIVNGIGLCNIDISADDCHKCLSQAASALVLGCPNQKDAIGWYETCMFRYSNRYIFRKLEFGPWFHFQDDSRFRDKGKFNQTAATLLAKLQNKAASGDSSRKYAAGKANITSSYAIYAFAQCTPDLEYSDCYYCLDQAIYFALTQLFGQTNRVFYTSCKIRMEDYHFYNATYLNSLETLKPLDRPSRSPSSVPTSLPPSSVKRKKGTKNKKFKFLIIVVVSLVVTCLLLLVALFGCYYLWRKKGRKSVIAGAGDDMIRNPESLKMDFNTIKSATGNFNDANKLGRGGFGVVYKGVFPTGQTLAIKRLTKHSGHGAEEFNNEAVLVARLRHKNLVRFVGYCYEGDERLLIYELLPNKSLDCFLFDVIKRAKLDWQTRYKIIEGIARGLLYLHEESQLLVVHRDLKAGNILLDSEMNPKISDFGMARLFGVDQTHEDTRKICGTFGYMPPEYVQHGHFSIKSDVYGFGVLLLEIISGLRVTSYYNEGTGEGLLSFAWRNWLEGTPLRIVDSTMSSTVTTTQVLRCINIGLLCVQENTNHRPIMSLVVLLLNNHDIAPPVPSRPAFLLHHDSTESDHSLNVPTLNEVTLSELDPR
ncbi:cysteine-rich receptor-like protein kinase 44 [Spinacia oleracea]|uniref:Cysteine-rich receptor-like protein kinase 44 n=1 Tax=Spinacia oleracea TaxID=3562 RepID=A0A9R0HW21_SPIOL|nr:cysteine-rich receptor-like protein kinase 44 [Spinacia oleracea]